MRMIKCFGGLYEHPDVGNSFTNVENGPSIDNGDLHIPTTKIYTYRKESINFNGITEIYYLRDDYSVELALERLEFDELNS